MERCCLTTQNYAEIINFARIVLMMTGLQNNIQAVRSCVLPDVKLVVVSKYRPVEQLKACYQAGERCFAESRPLEFEKKVKEMPSDIEWHFIGHLQTNKLRHVLPYASLVQSVDSSHLIDAIEAFNSAASRVSDVLLEVHVGAEQSKHGFLPDEIKLEVGRVAAFGHIRLRGLMGMASNTDDTARVESDFAQMQSLFEDIRRSFPSLKDFDQLSIGMSNDFKLAQRHGATMVRVGSAIFEG